MIDILENIDFIMFFLELQKKPDRKRRYNRTFRQIWRKVPDNHKNQYIRQFKIQKILKEDGI